jgi:hypothetical protein
MSVLTVDLLDVEYRGRMEEGRLVREHVATYQIRVSLPTDDAVTILIDSHPGLPRIGQPYVNAFTFDAAARWQGWEQLWRPNKRDKYIWHGRGVYSTGTRIDYREPMEPDDPLAEPAQWEITSVTETQPTDKYADGTPIQNSSQEMRTIDRYVTQMYIHVRKPLPPDTALIRLEFNNVNKVNADSFWGFSAGQLRIHDFRASQRYYNHLDYVWDAQWVVAVHPQALGWRVQFLDDGFTELKTDPVSGQKYRRPILDDHGMPVRQRALLNGSGAKLPPDAPPVYYPPSPKAIYEEIDFNSTMLPRDFGGRV